MIDIDEEISETVAMLNEVWEKQPDFVKDNMQKEDFAFAFSLGYTNGKYAGLRKASEVMGNDHETPTN